MPNAPTDAPLAFSGLLPSGKKPFESKSNKKSWWQVSDSLTFAFRSILLSWSSCSRFNLVRTSNSHSIVSRNLVKTKQPAGPCWMGKSLAPGEPQNSGKCWVNGRFSWEIYHLSPVKSGKWMFIPRKMIGFHSFHPSHMSVVVLVKLRPQWIAAPHGTLETRGFASSRLGRGPLFIGHGCGVGLRFKGKIVVHGS